MIEDGLRRRWQELVAELGSEGSEADVALEDLLRRHCEPHRRYHSMEHLAEVHGALDELPATTPAVRLAAWFHDAVYDPAGERSEEASAELAGRVLQGMGLEPPVRAEVSRLVRLTASHDAPTGDLEAESLCDADLSILAAGPERYVRYRRQVRAEYEHLDDDAWRRGRAAVLDGFLERDHIYRTIEGRLRWEDRARANLRAELLLLG